MNLSEYSLGGTADISFLSYTNPLANVSISLTTNETTEESKTGGERCKGWRFTSNFTVVCQVSFTFRRVYRVSTSITPTCSTADPSFVQIRR